jgi:hypothetical protein
MNRDPLVSFNTPFQSGDGLCYPVYPQNYYKTQTSPMFGGRKTKKSQKSQKGGGIKIGDYSQSSTVNDYPGTAYLTNPSQRNALTGSGVPQPMNPLTKQFLSNNMGITYATQAGGRKKKYKGGFDMESPGAFNNFSGNLGSAQGQNSGTVNRLDKQRGGKSIQNQFVNVAEEESPTMSILNASAPVQGMYPVLSGGRYKKYSKKGGNMPQPGMVQPGMAQPGMAQPGMPQPGMPQPGMPQPGMAMPNMSTMPQPTMPQPGMAMPNMQASSMPGMVAPAMPQPQPTMSQPMVDIMSGGRYKKYSKKGGNYIFTPRANFSSQPVEIATMDPLAQAQHIPKGGYDMKDMSGVDAQMAASDPSLVDIMSGGRKKSSRKLKGGVSDFATTLSSRGPINYPDALSAQRFRYFNKTGTFIPNTMLQYAAAPISTGYEADPNQYPMAYNDYIGGAAKKKKPTKKKAAPAKKKAAPAKKKAAPAKKKSASAKKKSTSAKKK